VLCGVQARPVKDGRRDGPAKPGSVGKRVSKLRAVDEELLWHAAPQYAGAADPALLDDRDACAVAAGAARGGDAARAGAKREHVEIIARHTDSLRSRVALVFGCHNPGRAASIGLRKPKQDLGSAELSRVNLTRLAQSAQAVPAERLEPCAVTVCSGKFGRN